MNIPDYISPIVGYRTWQWDSLGLKSLNNEQWLPGQPLQATCKRYSGVNLNMSYCGVAAALAGLRKHHSPPHNGCTCGIYAAKSVRHLTDIGFMRFGEVFGEVNLWGKIWDHRFGYRAQFAYPKTIVLPSQMVPKIDEVESRLETLIAYGADIFIIAPPPDLAVGVVVEDIPLWTKASGYNEAGFDWITERHRWRCSCREKERNLKVGDRVSVTGKGTGVVEHVDDDEVRLVLRSKLTLRIPRKQIVWCPLGFTANGGD
ncbi:MAG TPA: hypothetical protein VII23_23250 [Terriglobales bacterium]